MKLIPTQITEKSLIPSFEEKRLIVRLTVTLAVAACLIVSGSSARAQNQLANPGFEAGNLSGWNAAGDQFSGGNVNFMANATQTYYNAGQCPPDAPAENVNIYDGTYAAKVYGNFNSAFNYSYMQQTFNTSPGSTWSGSAWAYGSHEDLMSNPNYCWVDVSFFNSGGVLLSEYESMVITNLSCGGPNTAFPLDTWQELLVTNQVTPGPLNGTVPTGGPVIGTVPTGVLTAPAGSATVRYSVVFANVNYAGGSIYFDDCDLDLISGPVIVPPTISNLGPNGIILCSSNVLSYTASSTVATITNVQVVATTNTVSGSPNTVTYGLTSPSISVSGLGTTSAVVTLTLSPNTVYNLTASCTDSNGVSASTNAFFDTIRPVLVWEAEDFNYSGGVWVSNITADGGTFAYANDVGTATIDEQDANPGNGPHFYRPSDSVSVQGAYEVTAGGQPITRQKFIDYYNLNPGANANENTVDEEVGYNNVGDWLDYTRNFPTGNYNVYARYATDGSGAQSYFETVTSDPTQPNQTSVNNGTFSMTDNNWNVYQYVPLLDQYGNLVSVPLSGTQTVRVQIAPGGNPNESFYMIVPAVPPQTPVLQAAYPDGLHPFEPTNELMFTVGQGNGTPISASGIHLSLNGFDVTSQVSLSSTATNWTGTIPIVSNAVYSAVISVTNNGHLGSVYTINFDTFSQSLYMWEAEDWDFASGQFIDNPEPTADSTITGGAGGFATGTLATNSYYGFPENNSANLSVLGVDFFWVADGQSEQYRPDDAPGTQVTGDYLRQKFITAQGALSDPNIADFNLGWYGAGDWVNFTRNYPAGTYNVYGRMAGGAGAFSGTMLALVTGGWGSSSQTTNVLGYFGDPLAAGWQTWHWVPMLNANGSMATVQLNGSTNTLKLVSGNNLNVNFMMLVPAVGAPLPVRLTPAVNGTHINISFPTQAGHTYNVYSATSLVPPVTWTPLTLFTGDGTIKTATDAIQSGARFYRVEEQ